MASCLTLAAQGQRVVGFTPGRGEVGFDFDGTWRGYSAGSGSVDGAYRQWLRLAVSGSLVDHRIVSYDLSLNPVFSQRVLSAWQGPLASTQLGYEWSIRALSGSRVAATVTSARRSGSGSNTVAGRNKFGTTQFGAGLFVRLPAVPLSLTYTQRSRRDEWMVPGLPEPLGRSDAWRGLTFLAQNSKTRLTLERATYKDFTDGGDFSSLGGNLDHTLRWGKGSSLGSSVETLRREGSDAHTRRQWSETLQLQHTRHLATHYSVMRQSRHSVGAGEMQNSALGGGIGFQPRAWLSLGGTASRQTARWESGRSSWFSAAPRLDFQARLPLRAQLAGGASAGYERRVEQTAGDGWAPVADETHVVDSTRTFVLENFDADPGSVVIRSADQTLTYQAGIDYRLASIGPRLQVEVLPGGRIAPGATVLVTYRYRLRPSGTSRAVILSYRATVTMAGLQLSHARLTRNQLGGGDTTVVAGETEESVTQLGMGRRTPAGWLQLSASHKRLRSRNAEYTTYELGGTLALPARPTLQSSVGGSVMKAATGDRHRNTWTLRSGAVWTPDQNLRVEGGIEIWTWQPDAGAAERFSGARLGVNWTFAGWETAVTYQFQGRETTMRSTDHRLSARLLRRF